MTVDFVISLEGTNLSCGPDTNLENSFLLSDGRVVRIPMTLSNHVVPDEFINDPKYVTERPTLFRFIINDIVEIFTIFADSITDFEFLTDTFKFLVVVLIFCVVCIQFIVFSFGKA